MKCVNLYDLIPRDHGDTSKNPSVYVEFLGIDAEENADYLADVAAWQRAENMNPRFVFGYYAESSTAVWDVHTSNTNSYSIRTLNKEISQNGKSILKCYYNNQLIHFTSNSIDEVYEKEGWRFFFVNVSFGWHYPDEEYELFTRAKFMISDPNNVARYFIPTCTHDKFTKLGMRALTVAEKDENNTVSKNFYFRSLIESVCEEMLEKMATLSKYTSWKKYEAKNQDAQFCKNDASRGTPILTHLSEKKFAGLIKIDDILENNKD